MHVYKTFEVTMSCDVRIWLRIELESSTYIHTQIIFGPGKIGSWCKQILWMFMFLHGFITLSFLHYSVFESDS